MSKDYRNFRHFEETFKEVISEHLTLCRDMGMGFKDVDDFASGMECDMSDAYEEWFLTGAYDFDTNDCVDIMTDNAYPLLRLVSAVNTTSYGYVFNTLDPMSFVEDVYCVLIYEYVLRLIEGSEVLQKITEKPFDIDFPTEYIFQNELEKFRYDVWAIVEEMILKAEDMADN